MKKVVLLVALCCCMIAVLSQEPAPEQNNEADNRKGAPGLFGKVVDNKTNKPLEAASVQIFTTINNKDSLIAGMLTKPNGDFLFPDLHLPQKFTVIVTALGYGENYQSVELPGDYGTSKSMNLGNIKLDNQSDLLGAVIVTAQKPALQMGIDRRVFNVDKNLASTGGTAIDVMRNIPSVTVDAEGNVQLRKTSPQLFVDGRPTILTLEQIPADDIERVELITNPSAKFDAASSGGIINVVLKKSKKLGFNGLASAGVGIPNVLTGSLSLNVRKNKFNFFLSTNLNNAGGNSKSESVRQNKDRGIITDYFNQLSTNDRRRKFNNIRFGADYFLNSRNTISVSQNFVNGRFFNYQTQNQEYFDEDYVLTQTGKRTSDYKGWFNRSITKLNYTHNFSKAGRELTADITYNTGNGGNRAAISSYFYLPNGNVANDPSFVNNRGENGNDNYTIQVDYVDPITENTKLEMGLRTFRQDNSSMFNAFALNNNVETKLPLSNNVLYNESVHAAYITYSNKSKIFNYQLGLRGEYARFNGTLVDSAEKFGYKLPLDIGSIFDGLFPSVYLTKQLTENKELQLNFSRRIRRPDFWQLNPFIDINDPLNLTQGNPRVKPEYVNSFEFNYNQKYEKGNFFASLYFRNNTANITRFSDTITTAQYEALNNAAIGENAILNTFINAQFTNRMGAEFTLNYKFGRLEIIPNVNLQYRRVKAEYNGLNLSNQGFNWNSKMIFNYKIGSKLVVLNNLNIQLINEYESPEVIPQGKNIAEYSTDFALRKEFLKNNVASLTFAINDVFNTRRSGQIYDTDNFYQDSYRRWDVRSFRLSFSYRFGNKDLSFFGQKDKKQEDD
jgi:outer membrane receptor protein involved in Fe transport